MDSRLPDTFSPSRRRLFLNTDRMLDHDARRRHIMRKRLKPITWRDQARICIPGHLIKCGIEALARPLYLAGPNLAQRLERHVELLDALSCRSRFQRMRLSLARWLLQAPNDAHQPIPDRTPHDPSLTPILRPAQGSAPVSLTRGGLDHE